MAVYEPPKNPLQAISSHDLNRGNALSFTAQPHLRQLFDVLLDSQIPITFIVGAGASIDSGFPPWSGLLDELIAEIDDPDTQRLAYADRTEDSMRRVESILRLLSPSRTETDSETYRNVLYKRTPTTEPGDIATNIAALCQLLGTRSRLLTTNFDDVLEEALRQCWAATNPKLKLKIKSYSSNAKSADKNGYRAWKKSGNGSVLHLHGMLRRRAAPLNPIILTESQFLKSGPRVREIVQGFLKKSAVIFVGVSLTDPNLVAPLWEVSQSKDRKYPSFVLHVPTKTPKARTIEEARAFALKKFEYLELRLGTKPIFLKSYSQLHQCLHEMNICLRLGPAYFEDQLSYGARFSDVLSQCYEALGMENTQTPKLKQQIKVSKRLGAELVPSGRIGEILHDPGDATLDYWQQVKKYAGDFSHKQEDLGLFIWLRVRPPATPSDSRAPYALQLVASSTYVHREAWSFVRELKLEPASRYPAAEAVYYGRPSMLNLPKYGTTPLWNGGLAVPIFVPAIVDRKTGVSDRLLVGAAVLNTTHLPVSEESRRVKGRPISILAALTPVPMGDLMEAIQTVALEVLTEPT